MKTGVSVAPPSCRSMCLQPEPPVVTESRPRHSSQSSESHHSSKCESRPHLSPECESRPCCSPEDENVSEYFIIFSPLYLILYAFLYKINALFLFLLTTFLIIYISDSLRSSKGAYNSSCYEVNILASS